MAFGSSKAGDAPKPPKFTFRRRSTRPAPEREPLINQAHKSRENVVTPPGQTNDVSESQDDPKSFLDSPSQQSLEEAGVTAQGSNRDVVRGQNASSMGILQIQPPSHSNPPPVQPEKQPIQSSPIIPVVRQFFQPPPFIQTQQLPPNPQLPQIQPPQSPDSVFGSPNLSQTSVSDQPTLQTKTKTKEEIPDAMLIGIDFGTTYVSVTLEPSRD